MNWIPFLLVGAGAVAALCALIFGSGPPVFYPVLMDCPYALPPTFLVDCFLRAMPLEFVSQPTYIRQHMIRVRTQRGALPVAQLFVLAGGPGLPGDSILPLLARWTGDFPLPLVIYIPDHRGTGQSAELACPDGSQTLTAKCVAALAKDRTVLHYTISNAARDVEETIRFYNRRPFLTGGNLPIFLLGTGYGTAVLNRYLVMFPNTPVSGVILDSLLDPTYPHYSLHDVEANAVGEDFLLRTTTAPPCAALWNESDPVLAARALLQGVQSGTDPCISRHFPSLSGPGGAARLQRFVFYQSALTADTYQTRLVLPAVVFRLQRCSAADVRALAVFFASVTGLADGDVLTIFPGTPGTTRPSNVLGALIVLSELFSNSTPAPSSAGLATLETDLIFTPNYSVEMAELLESGFPRYPIDQYARKLADPKVPVLVLNGDLDMDYLMTYVTKITASRPKWYFRPLLGLGQSPLTAAFGPAPCVLRLILAFLGDPATDPFLSSGCDLPFDLDCAVNSSLGALLAASFFNASSLYDP